MILEKLVLIDGNNILNRAFYGIMGSKMLMTSDGRYTNAVYGFLAILFKIIDELNPEYLVVTFDLKAPTARHKMYEGYKANRKGMPNELAEQMPIIKDILHAMNIDIVEKEGYEADDVMGTLSRYGEKQGLEVVIVSGDRDTFQLATDKTTIKIPRTKAGKTETEDFDRKKVLETYGVEPKQLIEVKGLQGDTSDNIPGIPGIGEKTALNLIKKYENIDNLYKMIEDGTDDLKGKQREKIVENKDLAYLSRTLGTINLEVPIEDTLDNFKVEEWDNDKVLEIFKELNFNRFIERFGLEDNKQGEKKLDDLFIIKEIDDAEKILDYINNEKTIIYHFSVKDIHNEEKIIQQEIVSVSFYNEKENIVYYINNKANNFVKVIKSIFEDENIEKYGFKMTKDYILLKQMGIQFNNIKFDIEVAAYILNSTNNKYTIETLSNEYLNINLEEYLDESVQNKQEQLNLFDAEKDDSSNNQTEIKKNSLYAYCIKKIETELTKKLKETNTYELFETVDMPTVEVLSSMQWDGMYLNLEELEQYGEEIKQKVDKLTKEIYDLCDTEFNINSPKQLGEVLFEKLELPAIKKTKNGYSTAEEVLERLKSKHPVIEKILEYRQVMKLNSTYVEGLKPYINPKTKRIHSFFHQTITATGRISSTEPNLQNIPVRMELGKKVRKVFKPAEGCVYIDADYSQIELRVLAHISEDENMIEAFNNGEDIHKQAASKVFGIPMDKVTKEQRSNAKAVNFGIVYGISEYGLGMQLGIPQKKAKQYIEQYLEKYSGIKKFMENISEEAKEKGYVETLYHRRRYVPELQSNNFMVRSFGKRVAMNTPIQGTAADIMKIAMIKVYNELRQKNMKAKIVLQVHDEMMIEAPKEEADDVKEILKRNMENVVNLKVPLVADVTLANNWYDAH
ncbi:MAG: DNA polymerase I [Clostridia bacterium]|nr:DNA polymerase I [Clostridia bacterium]